MKIQVHYTKNYMKYDLVSSNYFNIGHLDLNTFRSFSDRKIDFIKRIFVDNEQYDIVRFFYVLSQIKSFKITEWVTDNLINEYVEKLKRELTDKT